MSLQNSNAYHDLIHLNRNNFLLCDNHMLVVRFLTYMACICHSTLCSFRIAFRIALNGLRKMDPGEY